jgi:hypothetical protein
LLADQTPEHQLTTLLVHLFESGQLRPIHNKPAQEILEELNGIEAIRGQLRNLLHDDVALLGRYLGRIIADPNRALAAGLTAFKGGEVKKRGVYSLGTPHPLTASE